LLGRFKTRIASPANQLSLLHDVLSPFELCPREPLETVERVIGPTRKLYLVMGSDRLRDRFSVADSDNSSSPRYTRDLAELHLGLSGEVWRDPPTAARPAFGAALERALISSATTVSTPWMVHWYGIDFYTRHRQMLGRLHSVPATQFRLDAASLPEGAVTCIEPGAPVNRTD